MKKEKNEFGSMDINIEKFTWKELGSGIEYTLKIDSKVCYRGEVFDDLIKELKKYLRLRFKEIIK